MISRLSDVESVPQFGIVGAGPVGTLLAYDLGRRGLSCVVLDNATPTLLRKAGSCNIRTMEHLRRFGLAQDAIDAFPLMPGHDLDIVFVTGFSGYEIHRFEKALGWAPHPASAEVTQMIPQKTLQTVVRRKIEENFGSVHFIDAATATAVSQDRDGVHVQYTDAVTNQSKRIECRYLIGCDGGASTVRRQIEARWLGEGATASNMRILFSAPSLYMKSTIRIGQQFWVVSDKVNASFGWGRGYQDSDWIAMTLWMTDETLEGRVRADPESFIFAGVGFEFPVEIINIDVWKTHNLVADRWRQRRIFLAGDAAHLHPPTGGLGLNTGIGDVADIGWKLAAAAQGWGGPLLLESYEAERRAAALRVVSQANHNYKSGSPGEYYEPGIDEDGAEGDRVRERAKHRIIADKTDEFYSPGLVLGTAYFDSPVIVPDGTPAPAESVIEYHPSARPGGRLPHSTDAAGIPIFAKLTEGMNLVGIGGIPDSVLADASARAAARGIPLAAVDVDVTHLPLYGARYLLVRPDHYVAWRSDNPPDDWNALLAKVTGWGV
ncbi:MAG: FAD-dependent monooxygenase [Xanthobacteraceae bacterium]|nr:FAD-dependent monooxygenase [Xanthobacteraceae bacterium]